MAFAVTDAMRADVKKAVEELERNTTGEMVCVVAQASAHYNVFPILWAALLALLCPLLNPIVFTDPEGFVITFGVQSAVFVTFAALLLMPQFRHKCTPDSVCLTNCRRFAFEQFFSQKLNETKKRLGVMLFVSLEEKYVELIADKGINDKVDAAVWAKIVDDFIADIRTDKVHEGYIKAVRACQDVLKSSFPDVPDDVNELGDGLVELPRPKFLS